MIGGETRGEGRGIHHKSIVVGAVEVRSRQDDGKKHKRRKTRWIIAPSALGFLISSAETNAIGYRILPFADAPQWIPVADSPDQSP